MSRRERVESPRTRVPRFFFFSSRRRHTRCGRDWSSDVCSSDLCTRRSRVLLAYLALGTADVGALIHSAVAFAAAWFAGERTRLRRVQLDELRDRADRAERAATRERELRSEERRVGKECRSRWSP